VKRDETHRKFSRITFHDSTKNLTQKRKVAKKKQAKYFEEY